MHIVAYLLLLLYIYIYSIYLWLNAIGVYRGTIKIVLILTTLWNFSCRVTETLFKLGLSFAVFYVFFSRIPGDDKC